MSGGKTQKILSKILATFFFAVLFVFVFINFDFIYKKAEQLVFQKSRVEIEIGDDISTTTSTSTRDSVPTNTSINIVLVGDIMLDRRIRRDIDQKGADYVFGGVKDLIEGADIAIGNLEGPITGYPSKTIDFSNKSLQFTFDPSVSGILRDYGFDVLGLGNNHLLDFGESGYSETLKYLSDAGLSYYGHPMNNQNISTVATAKGFAIGLVGYHQFTYANKDLVIAEISRLKPYVDILIVTPHWGEEYQPAPSKYIRDLAREFVRAGADAIIGTHPHVIQGGESVDGVPVIYSLGNFVFDQDFSKETQLGMAVTINIQKKKATDESPKIVGASVSGVPISIVGSRASVATSTSAVKAVDKVLESLLTR